MALNAPLTSDLAASAQADGRVVHRTHTLLKYLFTAVPIIAGADKFSNLLAHWDAYLNPAVLRLVPVSATTFMHLVGAIEIVAGLVVFAKPRVGAWVVMAWLLGIALQLLAWGQFLDVAVRDIVIALSGPLVLAWLTPVVSRHSDSHV